MPRSKVAIVRTSPATILADYHRLMNLAGYQEVIAKDADTALKINISWHFFYPAASTTRSATVGTISSKSSRLSQPPISGSSTASRTSGMPRALALPTRAVWAALRMRTLRRK